VRCAECDGYGHEYPDGGVICIDCNGSGENWRYEGGVVAKWYAGPLITETEKSDDTE
jgi:DnaJ-class molecular chaperone